MLSATTCAASCASRSGSFIVGDVTVTDEEVRTFYDVFRDNYRTEERIVARVIAVNDQELANELAPGLTGESFAELASNHSGAG